MSLPSKPYYGDNDFLDYDVLDKRTLNYFDVKANSNKFYTIEIHECNGKFRVFTEYGRVGMSSKKEVRETDVKYAAKNEFERILKEKKKKGYVEIELAQSITGSQKAKELIDTSQIKIDRKTSTKSNLDPDIQQFVKQIFDETGKKLNQFVRGSSDSNGASPLGKLSVNQIEKGRGLLQNIADIVERNSTEGTEGTIVTLSNEYYRHIPKSFGRYINADRIAINTQEKINNELDMLKFYEDSLRMGSIIFDTTNVDKQYESLHSDIGILDCKDDKYIDIVNYVRNSQSTHHGVNLNVKRIFTVSQHNAPKFDNSPGNTKELFHGSRSANLPGILSSHLKLPNQLRGVQITGAMFGPGIYFADQSTKSSQYSCSRFGGTANSYDTAFMFIANVALGKIKEEEFSKYYYKAPDGYDSVKGVAGKSLIHNEYITYKENQQELRYIVEFSVSGRSLR